MNIQFFIDCFSQGCLYFLFSLSLALVLYPLRIFHVAMGCIAVFSGYMMFWGIEYLHLSYSGASILAVVSCCGLGWFMEVFVYRPLFAKQASRLSIAISSFAIYLALINLLSAVFGNRYYNLELKVPSFLMGENRLSGIQGAMILCALGVAVLIGGLKRTRLGLALFALEDSEDLLRVCRWNLIPLRNFCLIASSFLAGLAGVLMTLESGVDPHIGMDPLLNALVIVIATGRGSFLALFPMAIFLSLLQGLAYTLSPEWTTILSVGLLTGFLIFRPAGIFTGHRRVEEWV